MSRVELKLGLSLVQKRAIAGYLFVLPFVIGFVFFYLYPVIQSIQFSFSELSLTPFGFALEYVGLDNYSYALFTDTQFVRVLVDSVLRTLADIPTVVIFSFFVASLLNQQFKGRTFARIVFFLPVILSAGVLYEMERQDILFQSGAAGMVSADLVRMLIMQAKLPEWFVEYIVSAAGRLPDIINASAIPILIFLAGLQSIPTALSEAASIEGATSWEVFWIIYFPLMTPLFLANTVFIIINSFTAPSNPMVGFISSATWGRGIYGVSVAMTWMYFTLIGLLLLLTVGIASRKVFYME